MEESVNTTKTLIRIESKIDNLALELKEHKDRHAIVFDVVVGTGKLIVGITTVISILGGFVLGFYYFVRDLN